MNEKQTSLIDAIDYLNAVRKQNIRRLTVVRTLWVALILSILFFYLDAVLILSSNQRMLMGISLLLAIAFIFILTPIFLNRTRNREKMLARLIESKHPDMDNALVNAIDFDHNLKEHRT